MYLVNVSIPQFWLLNHHFWCLNHVKPLFLIGHFQFLMVKFQIPQPQPTRQPETAWWPCNIARMVYYIYIYYNYGLSWPDVGPSHKMQGTFEDMRGSILLSGQRYSAWKRMVKPPWNCHPAKIQKPQLILPSLNQTWLAGNYFVRKSEAVLSYWFAEGVPTKIKNHP